MTIRKKEWLAIADEFAAVRKTVLESMDARSEMSPTKALLLIEDALADVLQVTGKSFDKTEFANCGSYNRVTGRHKKYRKRE